MIEEMKRIEKLRQELALLKSGESGLGEPYRSSEIRSLQNEIDRLLKEKF